MKVGMIIVFDTNDYKLLEMRAAKLFNSMPQINFCLVNNNCSEMFGEALMDIADECSNVAVVHVKRTKKTSLAVRAGSRYLNNHFNLKFLGYITDLQGEELFEAIKLFAKEYEEIRTSEGNQQSDKLIKQTFFQRIFSVSNYYHKMNLNLNL